MESKITQSYESVITYMFSMDDIRTTSCVHKDELELMDAENYLISSGEAIAIIEIETKKIWVA